MVRVFCCSVFGSLVLGLSAGLVVVAVVLWVYLVWINVLCRLDGRVVVIALF